MRFIHKTYSESGDSEAVGGRPCIIDFIREALTIPRGNRAFSLTRASPRASLSLARENFRKCRSIVPGRDHTATCSGGWSMNSVSHRGTPSFAADDRERRCCDLGPPRRSACLDRSQVNGGPAGASVRPGQGSVRHRRWTARILAPKSGGFEAMAALGLAHWP